MELSCHLGCDQLSLHSLENAGKNPCCDGVCHTKVCSLDFNRFQLSTIGVLFYPMLQVGSYHLISAVCTSILPSVTLFLMLIFFFFFFCVN